MKKVAVNAENRIVFGNVSEKTGKMSKVCEDVTESAIEAVAQHFAGMESFRKEGMTTCVIRDELGVVEDLMITVSNPSKRIVMHRKDYEELARAAGRI